MRYKKIFWLLIQVNLLLVCLPANASNDDKFYRFDIPAQSLFETIGSLSKITGKTSLFPYNLVESKTAKPLKGFYTTQQALDALLSDTGLKGDVLNNNTFMIKRRLAAKSATKVTKTPAVTEIEKIDNNQENDLQASIEVIDIESGYSASEIDAINMKKFTDSISDNLAAEDIGVLPDQSIAESLERITGVFGNKIDGRSDTVNVRGMSGYTLTTLNGREIVSSFGARSVNLTLYPSEAIRTAQVFKTAKADSLEGGIGGTINIETIKPLTLKQDIKSFSASVAGNSNLDDSNMGDSYGKKINALFSQHFTDDFAIAVGVAYQEEPKLLESAKQSELQTWANYSDNYEGEGSTWSHEYRTKKIDMTRKSIFSTAQWQINDQVLITIDGLLSSYEYDQYQLGIVFGDFDPLSYPEDVVINQQTGYVEMAKADSSIFMSPSSIKNKDDTEVLGLNLSYDVNDSVNLNIDLSHSSADRHYNWRGSWNDFGSGLRHEVSFDNSKDSAGFSYYGSDLNNDGNLTNIVNNANYYEFSELWNDISNVYSTNQAARADLTIDTDFKFFHQFKIGIRASKNTKEVYEDDQYLSADLLNDTDFSALQTSINDKAFTQFDHVSGLEQVFFYNANDVISQNADIIPDRVQDAADRAASYDLTEETINLYLQTSFAGSWFDGSIGIRYYKTELDSTSEQFIPTVERESWDWNGEPMYKMYWPIGDESNYVTAKNDYDDILPSLNVNLRFIDDVVIRVGAGKAMIRPTVNDLHDGVSISSSVSDGKNFGPSWDPESASLGTAGNAKLKPITSKQADVSFEWYPNKADYYALAFFYKDLDAIYNGNYFFFDVDNTVDQNGDPVKLPLQQKIMGEGGTVDGSEFSFRKNFAFVSDYLNGFNISGNYMKFNNDAVQDYNPYGEDPWGGERETELLYRPAGWIDETWNVTFTYDITQNFSARYNINQQSEMVIGDIREYRLRLPSTTHSMSMQYKIKNFAIFAKVSNLTNEKTEDAQIHLKEYTAPQIYALKEQQYLGTSFYIGASASF